MIKRVKTAKAVPPRRGLLPRLRNVRIRSKLGLILIIPIVALVGIAAVRLAEAGQSVMQAQDAMKYATVSQMAAELGEHLQTERSLAAVFLTSPPDGRQAAETAYEKQWNKTNQRIDRYQAERGGLRSVTPALKQLLSRIDTQLGELSRLRNAVVLRDKLPLSSAVFRYRILIADLLAYRESLAHVAGDAETADLARGSAALAAYTEYTSQEQVVGLQMLASDELTNAQKDAFLATLAGQAESLRAFGNAVDDRHMANLQRAVAGKGVGAQEELQLEPPLNQKSSDQIQAAVQNADRYESDIRRAEPGAQIKLQDSAAAKQWVNSMAIRIALTREVEEQIDSEFKDSIRDQHDELIRGLVAQLLTVLLVLFVAVLIALLIARSMARSLRRLREGALSVAYESLPQSVARLRNPETLGELSPDQVAAGVKDPVQVRGRDEIGQVSQAFNVVHREAVRIAAEQAALRANVATMFINLARRSQVLVDRLIGHLDRLERGEEDPDRLAELFQLDHLATRMRRNDENLLVLAGADSTRVQREPAPLSDVLRAAQSEVEQYTRLEFGIVDRDVEVAPHAVNDVVHLLAELFDNATSFSPPDTVVVVDARRAGDRAILQIEDRGIGISAEQLAELNARLASPPLVDVAVSRMMGLVVVGRLAARHGVRVELRAARDRGTIADVILPAGALILPHRAGRQHTLGLPQARSPLALEGADRGPQVGGWDEPHDPGTWTPPAAGTGWDAAPPWEPPQTMPKPPRQAPDRVDQGTAITSGLSGPNGSSDRQLPRRRPGEGITPTGQPISAAGQQPPYGGPAGRPQDNPANEVLARQPAAEPRIEPRPARGEGSDAVHGIELPASHRAPGEAPSQRRTPSDDTPSHGAVRGPADGSSTFGITGMTSGGYPVVTPPAQSNGDTAAPVPSARASARPAPTAGGSKVAGDSSLIPPNADDTMELPIFREVESAWFRTKQPQRPVATEARGDRDGAARSAAGSVDTVSPSPAPPAQRKAAAQVDALDGGVAASPAEESYQGAPAEAEGAAWQTAADDGWRAASAAADVAGTDTTESGLPKRVPMAQLVPGGVDNNATAARNRSPDAVRGLLSAYHRGVQRGRQSSVRTNDESPGKEQA